MAAVRNGIGGAALALTVDTIVHRVNPPLAIEPGGLPVVDARYWEYRIEVRHTARRVNKLEEK